MTRTVIGAGISVALLAMTAACSGSSSASLSPAAPSTSAFAARTLSSAGTLTTLDHGHSNDQGAGPGDAQAGEHDGKGNGREAQLEGTIVSIDTAHTSFVVRTTTVNVLATTIIRRGDTTLAFADLKVGDQVHVKGAMNDKAIDAREVKVQSGEAADDGGEASGPVSALAGTCPAITFTVGTTKVATSAATTFGGSVCTDVVNGAQVQVKGTVQTDGSILATRVSIDRDGADEKD